MINKILKGIIVTAIFLGFSLSIFNFLPRLNADTIFGSRTTIDNPDLLWHYYQMYGIDGLADRHIMNDDYCVDDPCDCAQVIEV